MPGTLFIPLCDNIVCFLPELFRYDRRVVILDVPGLLLAVIELVPSIIIGDVLLHDVIALIDFIPDQVVDLRLRKICSAPLTSYGSLQLLPS